MQTGPNVRKLFPRPLPSSEGARADYRLVPDRRVVPDRLVVSVVSTIRLDSRTGLLGARMAVTARTTVDGRNDDGRPTVAIALRVYCYYRRAGRNGQRKLAEVWRYGRHVRMPWSQICPSGQYRTAGRRLSQTMNDDGSAGCWKKSPSFALAHGLRNRL